MEDEWHLLFVCPLYDPIRGTIPFTGDQVLVDGGHVMQGQGCSERNLTSLVRHVMALPRFDVVVDFLLRAFKMRRNSRRNQLPYQWYTLPPLWHGLRIFSSGGHDPAYYDDPK